jgi:Na+:H+ antiporter, NhaA family
MARRTHIRLPFGRRLPPIGDEFVSVEALGGIALLGGTLVALAWANASPSYFDFWHRHLTVGVADFSITEDLRHWVNDGLMAVFFFVVGLEIKRELVTGELRDPRRALLPGIAAVGGMVVPALVFLAFNPSGPASDGWGIPMATDIAFAVGVLTLLGSRVPPSLRLFLLTLAIVDDIGAIIVIAVFYSGGISRAWLAGAAAMLLLFFVLQRLRIQHPLAYVLPAVVLWVCTFESGVHATIAGIALGLLAPAKRFHGRPVIDQLEHHLHPWTSFLVVPVFALANAGVQLGSGELRDAAASSLTWGVVAGLVIGKAVGISGAVVAAVRLRLTPLPDGVGVRHVAGVAILAGIGFTVSLFIADLSFGGTGRLSSAKVGVLAGSLVSGTLGALVLFPRPPASSSDA